MVFCFTWFLCIRFLIYCTPVLGRNMQTKPNGSIVCSVCYVVKLKCTICLSQRDMLRLGVDECMDRFNPSVKHHCYQVDFVPVVRNQGSDR